MFIQITMRSMDFYNKQKKQKEKKKEMSERRSWTEEEDRALKYLKDTLQVKKWSQISRRLEFEFNIPGRNGKQCRERYTNHLDSSIISKEFTSEDEEKLFKLHDKIGNKWSLISKEFLGRTDNHIKNHFHSKLRKGIRKLNKDIKQYFKKTIKQFKLTIIYKVVEASDYRFSDKLLIDEPTLESFNQLKNFLLQYAGGMVQKSELSDLSSKDQAYFLVSRLEEFERFLKNKKMAEKTVKKNLIQSNQKINQILVQNDSSSNSENAFEQQKEMESENEENESICDEDGSFQFMMPVNNIPHSSKSMQDETASSLLPPLSCQARKLLKQSRFVADGFYSFLKQSDDQQDKNIVLKQSSSRGMVLNIPSGLIEQIELPQTIQLAKKFSVNSFDSLREFDDQLNESQINLLIKKFDSYSDIEAGLFQ